MTQAICIYCGTSKFGALTSCDACGRTPTEDKDIDIALILSDHFHDLEKLAELGAAIANGARIVVDED